MSVYFSDLIFNNQLVRCFYTLYVRNGSSVKLLTHTCYTQKHIKGVQFNYRGADYFEINNLRKIIGEKLARSKMILNMNNYISIDIIIDLHFSSLQVNIGRSFGSHFHKK